MYVKARILEVSKNAVELLHGELTVQFSDDDVAMPWLDGTINHQKVVLEDADCEDRNRPTPVKGQPTIDVCKISTPKPAMIGADTTLTLPLHRCSLNPRLSIETAIEPTIRR